MRPALSRRRQRCPSLESPGRAFDRDGGWIRRAPARPFAVSACPSLTRAPVPRRVHTCRSAFGRRRRHREPHPSAPPVPITSQLAAACGSPSQLSQRSDISATSVCPQPGSLVRSRNVLHAGRRARTAVFSARDLVPSPLVRYGDFPRPPARAAPPAPGEGGRASAGGDYTASSPTHRSPRCASRERANGDTGIADTTTGACLSLTSTANSLPMRSSRLISPPRALGADCRGNTSDAAAQRITHFRLVTLPVRRTRHHRTTIGPSPPISPRAPVVTPDREDQVAPSTTSRRQSRARCRISSLRLQPDRIGSLQRARRQAPCPRGRQREALAAALRERLCSSRRRASGATAIVAGAHTGCFFRLRLLGSGA